MEKSVIRMTESDLHHIVNESVRRVLQEAWINDKTFGRLYIPDESISAMDKAFTSRTKGSEILSRGIKIIQGKINPELYYREAPYNWEGNNLFSDVIIEYPDGKRHTLMRK